MLAVKKLMLESLLNCRLRGNTLKYEELLIVWENIITDEVSTAQTTSEQHKGMGKSKWGSGEGPSWTHSGTQVAKAARKRVVEQKKKLDLHAIGEAEKKIKAGAVDNEEEMQAWCRLEESEHEQWQEVISRKDKQKQLKSHVCLSVECGKQVKVRVTVDSGAARH